MVIYHLGQKEKATVSGEVEKLHIDHNRMHLSAALDAYYDAHQVAAHLPPSNPNPNPNPRPPTPTLTLTPS